MFYIFEMSMTTKNKGLFDIVSSIGCINRMKYSAFKSTLVDCLTACLSV